MASLLLLVLLPLSLFFLLSLLASAFLYLHFRRPRPPPSPDLPKQPLVTTHTWQEIQAMTHNFSTTVIAHGGFSTVYLTSTTPTSAVKVHNTSERLHSAFLRELHVLLRLRHVAIVTLTGFSDNGDQGALVFEYEPNGTLHEKLHEGGGDGSPLSWPYRVRIALQLASALEYLHEGCELQVVHGDLKPSNVLLDEDLNCKLCDFGSAMMGFSSTLERQQTMVGSVGYVDPYYVRTGVVSKKSDVYSFGVVVLEMLTGKEAFCVEVVREPEEFADEEDYVKAGGSELLFVRMQGTKAMEKQSKIADKLPPIKLGETQLDLIVIGCGPAGLSLAAESAKRGLSVGLVGPDLPFTNNYGVWEDEFKDLGLGGCIEHVWRDTIVYLDNGDPILIGRAYGKVSRHLLHEELLQRCYDAGVTYLNSKVEQITETHEGHSIVACQRGAMIPCRLAIVASGAASGKLLQYEVGGPEVSVQTAYGVEVEVENNPYDPNLMVFMDYRDIMVGRMKNPAEDYPTFLYVMPLSSTRVFYEETCLASKHAMPFDLLKEKLMLRLNAMDIRIKKVYEEEWSYIPVGGSLPNTQQKNLAFGAAASMVHPATGYSVVRSLSEAPRYASIIATTLKGAFYSSQSNLYERSYNPSMQAWNTLWPQERKRQRAFFLFGLALITELDIEDIRTFFHTFFRLPKWMWQGFLGSTLSSVDLVWFAIYMFVLAPNSMRKSLVRHLMSDPTGATMIRTYLTM